MEPKSNVKLIVTLVSIFVGLIVVVSSWPFTIINSTERGIVLRNGAINRVLTEGLHWRTPLIEDVEKVDVTTQNEAVDSNAASKDLQTVSAKIAVNYNLDPNKVDALWRNFQGEHETRVIAPAVQEAVKAATAKYTAEELITKRELVKETITNNLKERLAAVDIIVTNVSIVNFDFSAQFNQAIEAKVTAEQSALAAKNKLEQVKYEAEQKVATAQAEAQSIRLQSEAANNQKYVELKQLDVQLEFAKKWNGQLPTNLYGSAPIPFLQLGGAN